MCISDYMQTTLFYLRRLLKKVVDDPCSSTTKGSIFYKKHVYTTFQHGSGLTRNLTFNGGIYYVFYLHILFYLVQKIYSSCDVTKLSQKDQHMISWYSTQCDKKTVSLFHSYVIALQPTHKTNTTDSLKKTQFVQKLHISKKIDCENSFLNLIQNSNIISLVS